MFNSFLDGSKPAIETTAVCNATGLTPAPDGLRYPAGSVDEIPSLMRPRDEGGVLHHKGQVEVISSLTEQGKAIAYDIRFGVWVVFEGETDYIRRCFEEYGVKTDPSGRYACLYKRWHLIGLEVGISVASVGLRGEPTGCATGWRADAVAIAKRNLAAGEVLDGEGGYTVVGRLMPAADSAAQGCLPLGLAHGWKMLRPVSAGQPVRWSDVAVDANATAVRVRREMESSFRERPGELGMQAIDDGARRAAGRKEAIPRRDLHAGHACFGERWHLRQLGGAPRRRHSERPQLSSLDLPHGGGACVEHHLDLTTEQVDLCLAAALVGHVHERCAGRPGERFAGDVLCAADARGRIAHRLLLRKGNEL